MPHQGWRRPADLLRLPSRALGSPANLEPNRECVRDRPAQDRQNQWSAVALHGPADGLQTCYGRLENLAEAEGRKPVAEGRGRCHVPRRDRDHRRPVKPRRLTAPSPKLHHSSDDAALRLIFAFDTADDNAVVQRTKFHRNSPNYPDGRNASTKSIWPL